MNKTERQGLRRRLEGLSEEEKKNKIKEIELKRQLAEWRYWGLKEYRDRNNLSV